MKETSSSDLFIYADDSAILVSHEDSAVVEKCLSEVLQNVGTWLPDNKLSLHLGKTQAILSGSRIKLGQTQEMKAKVGEPVILAKDTANHLGCTLDKYRSGSAMAMKVLTKICQKTIFLPRKSGLLHR